MREIRFRAWDKQRKEYLSGGEVFLAIQPGKHPRNIVYLDNIKDPDMFKDRFDLEQFTGLRDKGGREIYEGDIAKDPDGKTHVVKWQCYSAAWEFYGKLGSSLFVMRYPDMFEIIGNVHDNPELLNEIGRPSAETDERP
jgi:hypothetical protein